MTICPICTSSKVDQFCMARDYYETGDEFQLCRCETCEVVFTDYNFDAHGYDRYYQGAYYAHGLHFLQEGLREKVQRDLLRLKRGDRLPLKDLIRARLLKNFILVDLPYFDRGRILDVGCGAGKLLRVAQSVGFECHGAEPSKEAREILLNNGCRAYPSIDEVNVPENYFDIIVFNQSLEHIPDPIGALQKAVSLLKEDGQLVISVPNFSSNERRVFGMFWRHVDVPRHLFHFSPKTMDYIAQQLSLRQVHSRFKFWGGPGVAIQMARKEFGLKVYALMTRYMALQLFSLLTLNGARYGQMMTYISKRVVKKVDM